MADASVFRIVAVIDVYGCTSSEEANELLNDAFDLDGFQLISTEPAPSPTREANLG